MTLPAVSSVPAASAAPLTTATPANVTSMPLSAGNYLVWGTVDFTLAGATLTSLTSSLSLVSGSLSGQSGAYVAPGRLYPEPVSQVLRSLTTVTGSDSADVGPTVLSVLPGQTATLYLVAQAAFSAGTVAAFGTLFALPLPA